MKTLKYFIIKLNIFLIPFFIGLIFYCIWDPFMIIKEYNLLLDKNQIYRTSINKDYISAVALQKLSEKPNSFILGNSRSMFYEIAEWQRYIGRSKAIHYDASNESLYGIMRKLIYLDQHGYKIENVLLIIDISVLSQTIYLSEPLFILSPYHENNFLEFHWVFLKMFFSKDFLSNASNIVRSKSNVFVENLNKYLFLISYNAQINEVKFTIPEQQIAHNQYYSLKKIKDFYERPHYIRYSKPILGDNQKEMLQSINKIFTKHHTNFKIVISPLYDQEKISPIDLSSLISIFKKENIYDFSGRNIFTENYQNYYETSHYRPSIAKLIMQIIYKNSYEKNTH